MNYHTLVPVGIIAPLKVLRYRCKYQHPLKNQRSPILHSVKERDLGSRLS